MPGMLRAMSMPGRPNNASIGLLMMSNLLIKTIHNKERATLDGILFQI